MYSTERRSPAARDAASGDAVATSAAHTGTPGATARSAEAIPHERPPPPYGTTTASTSGSSSAISSPTVAFPAMTSESETGCTKSPSTPG